MELDSTLLVDVASRGSYAVAVGGRHGVGFFEAIALERTAEGWKRLELPELPGETLLSAVELTETGEPIFVGVTIDGDERVRPLVVDARREPPVVVFEKRENASLGAVAVGNGTAMAVGVASGGFAVQSVGGGPWVEVSLPSDDQSELGLYDVQYKDGRFLACGFDDGGPPYSVVATYATGAWTMQEVPGTNIDSRCLLEIPDGTLLVGGRRASESGPGDVAFLQERDPRTGAWIGLGIPGSPRLASVQDLHYDLSGSVTAALVPTSAGVMTGGIVRDARVEYELEGGIYAIAEGENGKLYSVGYEGEASTHPRPLILVLEP